eukprot:1096259-Prymnesium_polylepis.2
MALLLPSLLSTARLERVVLISRHGERERLAKHHTHLGEADDPHLTLGGIEHLSRVGAVLRELYLAPSCAHDTCLAGRGALDAHEIRAESSALARTLGTAKVVLDRMRHDATRPVPVYSRLESSDYVLRGYSGGKCAALTTAIGSWHS